MCLFSPRKNLNLVSGDSPPKELTDKSSATFVSVVSDLRALLFYFVVCSFAFVCRSLQGPLKKDWNCDDVTHPL